ncbi:unnamed protein product [Aphanomyces euteiches]|nr:hypothetical protein Ae201684P_000545 [Aphanomyces euteiches]KAH9131761.1 hypothetical protein AeRB84_021643 [Aphanomyces euteiches]
MGPRLRGDVTSVAPTTTPPPPLNMPQRFFKALTKQTNKTPASDFVLPFYEPETAFFNDLASAAVETDFELPFTESEIAAAEAVELTWIPPKYAKTSKNVYLVKKMPSASASANRCTCYGLHIPQRGSSTRPSQTAFSPPRKKKKVAKTQPTFYCGDTCHNKLVLIECGKDTCSAPDPSLCLNRPFQQKTNKATKVEYMGRKGFGLLADEAINAGDFVIEYVGEVIDEAMAAKRRAENEANGQTHTYMLEMEKDILIDAQFKGNVSRFINHSCAPNCAAQKWTCEGGIIRIGIVALNAIAPCEEITFDYQFTHVGAQSVACACGAATCKGKMGFKGDTATKTTDEKPTNDTDPLPAPVKTSSLALYKSARLERDWLNQYGYSNKRLFLSHEIPDSIDIDKYIQAKSRSKPKRSTTNWYHKVLTNPPAPSTSFLAGGLLDYTKKLKRSKSPAPSSKPTPPRKSFLESRFQFVQDVHQFAKGQSVWNEHLNVSPSDLDVDRLHKFVENVENGQHHQYGDTNDLNEDACHRCGTGGQLICCDGCPAAFHLSCVGLHNLPAPNVAWYCPSCKRAKSMPYLSQRLASTARTAKINPIFQVIPMPEKKRWKRRGRPAKRQLNDISTSTEHYERKTI